MKNVFETLIGSLLKEEASLKEEVSFPEKVTYTLTERISKIIELSAERKFVYLEQEVKVSELIEAARLFAEDCKLSISNGVHPGAVYLTLRIKDTITLMSDEFKI